MERNGMQVIAGTAAYSFNAREYVRVPAGLSFNDRFGSWRCRWGVGRMRYMVEPGVYAVGSPGENSPVFVSANYKMSFDRLRMELGGMDAWVMVIDTKGINVWCAAGKGTFGTDEIVRCVGEFGLGSIVSHNTLVVPQLGAPGVSAHKVKKECGFKVVYGPVRACDIPEFLAAGMVADEQMRRVGFPLAERVVLIPMDLLMWAKPVVFIIMFFLGVGGFTRRGFSIDNCLHTGVGAALLFLCGYLAGGILGPVLLPFLPGRAFSLKGVWFGLAVWGGAVLLGLEAVNRPIEIAAWGLILPAISSAITMNFTGTSTYTSLSGVIKEMRIALGLQLGAAVIGAGLWIGSLFV